MAISGFWQLDIKDLNLYACKKLDMASTVDMIILHFKNMEKLDIGNTNISMIPEGLSNMLLSECFREHVPKMTLI